MSPAPTTLPSPAQLRALLKRWHDSLELHASYLALDDDRYQHVQPWPRHERPARWIVELSREKVRVLTKLVEQRVRAGDTAFIEALELMGFLSTLVGLSSVERFIPLCDPSSERREVLNAPPARRETAAPAAAPARPAAQVAAAARAAAPVRIVAPVRLPAATKSPPQIPAQSPAQSSSQAQAQSQADDHTREMPALPQGRIGRMLLAQQAGVPYRIAPEPKRTASKKRSSESGVHATRSARPASAKPAAPAAAQAAAPSGIDATVVDDALRLLGWGRQWHELPEIIARLADRPPPTHIRRVLREQRGLIEKRHAAAKA